MVKMRAIRHSYFFERMAQQASSILYNMSYTRHDACVCPCFLSGFLEVDGAIAMRFEFASSRLAHAHAAHCSEHATRPFLVAGPMQGLDAL